MLNQKTERKEVILEKSKIERINFLAKKAREGELSADEKNEQQELRKEYIESIKRNFRATLDSITTEN